jgi:tripeptide aminopeptidase
MTDKNAIIDRFIRYARVNSQSDNGSSSCPSSTGQIELARLILEDLAEIGCTEISLDRNGYIMASIPSNVNKVVPVIGFIAHLDTSPDFSGKNVNPRVIENYDGSDIPLDPEGQIMLRPSEFPELLNYTGQDLIVTDGKTLLGADDKAGVTEIIEAVKFLNLNPDIPHGKIKIGFTPDEEIGRGADRFDVKKFGADFAYTMDGGAIGE